MSGKRASAHVPFERLPSERLSSHYRGERQSDWRSCNLPEVAGYLPSAIRGISSCNILSATHLQSKHHHSHLLQCPKFQKTTYTLFSSRSAMNSMSRRSSLRVLLLPGSTWPILHYRVTFASRPRLTVIANAEDDWEAAEVGQLIFI